MIKSFDELDNLQLDVLREIGNIGAGNAATAMAKMLDNKVDMKVPVAKILEFKDISEILGGAELTVVGILLQISGDLTGYIMFILQTEAALSLVNMLMKRESNPSDEFGEIEISALKEIGNIMASSYLSALSTLTNLRIKPSVPQLAIDMAGAIISVPAIQFGKVGDTALYIETEFLDGNQRILGEFFLIPDVETYDVLLRALGVM